MKKQNNNSHLYDFIAGTLGCVFVDSETHESVVTKCTIGEAWGDNDNDNEIYLLPKLYKENQTIIQVHNSTLKDSTCQEVQWNPALTMGAEVMIYVPQVHVNGMYI